MDLPSNLRSISLFAGGGGLDLGVALACDKARVVCYVEREAYASATLAARMCEGSLDPAPIWSDVTTFDGHPWRGRVDLISGGFPCQDVSNAGKRAGLDGERSGLWFEYARIIAEVRPRFVFIENVAALRSRGLDRVLESLAALGFDAEWDCFRASDVGAPHRRERIFILAHAVGFELRDEPGRSGRPSGAGTGFAGNARAHVGDAACELHQRVFDGDVTRGARPSSAVGELGNTDGARLEGRREPEPGRGDEWAPWPPGPEEHDRWSDFLRVRPDAEPSVCRGAHGLADGLEYRADRLRLLGNGVVPQVAALAFHVLWRRLMTE